MQGAKQQLRWLWCIAALPGLLQVIAAAFLTCYKVLLVICHSTAV
jgi:hypothetical protein